MSNLNEINNKLSNLNNLLDRKISILVQILNISEKQNGFSENSEENNFAQKQSFINELLEIDNMFYYIFESFNGALNKNKDVFKQDIAKMQNKIKHIIDLDLKIRYLEDKFNKAINNSKLNKPIISYNNVNKVNLLKRYKENSAK